MSGPCPVCAGTEAREFHRQNTVPVQSVVTLRSEAEARSFPTGIIRLAECAACGHVWNAGFEPDRVVYGDGYEETQGCSPVFREFRESLGREWGTMLRRPGCRAVEIGCGKGELLTMLCAEFGCSGLGFDPAFEPGRHPIPAGVDCRFERMRFPPEVEAGVVPADWVICSMTLEHIDRPVEFLRAIRERIGWGPDAGFFVMVPDAGRIWRETAFEDVYYEHCGYFGADSLRRALGRAGFRVERLRTVYGGQYLAAVAVPDGDGDDRDGGESSGSSDAWPPALERWEDGRAVACRYWCERVESERRRGGGLVVWGGGSKAVAFLGALGAAADAVWGVVDINPRRQGCFLPPGAWPVRAPEALQGSRATAVVVLNERYLDEVRTMVEQLGLSLPVEALRAPERSGSAP